MESQLKRKNSPQKQSQQLIKTNENHPSRAFAILTKNAWKPKIKKQPLVQIELQPQLTKVDFLGRAPSQLQPSREIIKTYFNGPENELSVPQKMSKINFGSEVGQQINRCFSPQLSKQQNRQQKQVLLSKQPVVQYRAVIKQYFPQDITKADFYLHVQSGLTNSTLSFSQLDLGRTVQGGNNISIIQKLQQKAVTIAQQKVAILNENIQQKEALSIVRIFLSAFKENDIVVQFINNQNQIFDAKIDDLNIRVVNKLIELGFIEKLKNILSINFNIRIISLSCLVQLTCVQNYNILHQIKTDFQCRLFTPENSIILAMFVQLNPSFSYQVLERSMHVLQAKLNFIQQQDQQKSRIRMNYIDEVLEISDDDYEYEDLNYIDTSIRGMLLQSIRQNNIGQLDHNTQTIAIQNKLLKEYQLINDKSMGNLFSDYDNAIYIVYLIQQCLYVLIMSNQIKTISNQIKLLLAIIEELNEYSSQKTNLSLSQESQFFIKKLNINSEEFEQLVQFDPSIENYIHRLKLVLKHILLQ